MVQDCVVESFVYTCWIICVCMVHAAPVAAPVTKRGAVRRKVSGASLVCGQCPLFALYYSAPGSSLRKVGFMDRVYLVCAWSACE